MNSEVVRWGMGPGWGVGVECGRGGGAEAWGGPNRRDRQDVCTSLPGVCIISS